MLCLKKPSCSISKDAVSQLSAQVAVETIRSLKPGNRRLLAQRAERFRLLAKRLRKGRALNKNGGFHVLFDLGAAQSRSFLGVGILRNGGFCESQVAFLALTGDLQNGPMWKSTTTLCSASRRTYVVV